LRGDDVCLFAVSGFVVLIGFEFVWVLKRAVALCAIPHPSQVREGWATRIFAAASEKQILRFAKDDKV
jgi:hypothetical protein